jgi:GntR family transcriptional regulator, galactonate operon transcriptional repressor
VTTTGNTAQRIRAAVGSPSGAPDGDGGKMHDIAVRTLAQWILGGRYAPQAALPREDELAELISVSRTTIRGAIKVLIAKGLIETGPRVGPRVRPRDDWRLLDPAVLSWHPDIRNDQELLSSLLEARRIIEPSAAELAARRATAKDLAAIESAYLGMQRALPVNNIELVCDADLNFHRSLIYASHNVVLRGLIGTIDAALRATFLISNELMASQAETLHVHLEVLECVRMRDPVGARKAMNSLLNYAAKDLDITDQLVFDS